MSPDHSTITTTTAGMVEKVHDKNQHCILFLLILLQQCLSTVKTTSWMLTMYRRL